MTTFCNPIGATAAERDSGVCPPGDWFDATGYNKEYDAPGGRAIHTGADFNCNKPVWNADAHTPVWAIGNGTVIDAREWAVWGNVIIVQHDDAPDGKPVYSRYAHVEKVEVVKGQRVLKGQQIARVGNAYGQQPYHLHFDISRTHLLRDKPSHWPVMDQASVLLNYADPIAFLRKYRGGEDTDDRGIPITLEVHGGSLNIRAAATISSPITGSLAAGKQVEVYPGPKPDPASKYTFVELADGRGWVAREFLKEPVPQQVTFVRYIKPVDGANVRAEPKLTAAVRYALQFRRMVVVDATLIDDPLSGLAWRRMADGSGYIADALLSEVLPALPAPAPIPAPPPITPAKLGTAAGIHVAYNGSAGDLLGVVERLARRGTPVPLVVVVSDPDLCAAIKQVSPTTTTVYRYVAGESDPRPFGEHEDAGGWRNGADWFDEFWHYHGKVKGVDFHQMYNEVSFAENVQSEEYARRVNEFELALMRRANEHDAKVTIGNYMPGVPEQKHIRQLRPAFAFAEQHGHALCYHAYTSAGNDAAFDTDIEYYALRWVNWVADFPRLRVVLGEAGHYHSPRFRGVADLTKMLGALDQHLLPLRAAGRQVDAAYWTIRGQMHMKWRSDDWTAHLGDYEQYAGQALFEIAPTPLPTPTPAPLPLPTPSPAPPPAWNHGIDPAEAGLGASAGGWRPEADELATFRQNNIKHTIIVAYEPNQAAATIQGFRGVGVQRFIIRIAVHLNAQNTDPGDAAEFARRTLPNLKEYAHAIGGTKDLMIQLHNEPNAVGEGFGKRWTDGVAYAKWHLEVAKLYRRELPGCRIGFAALSPGTAIAGIRGDEAKFVREAAAAIADSDWVAVHYYWAKADGSDIAPPIADWRKWFGSKPLVATEVGPGNDIGVTSATARKARSAFKAIGVPDIQWVGKGAGAWQNADWTLRRIVM